MYFSVCMMYLYANEPGRARGGVCVCLCVFVRRKAGVTAAGEQMVDEDLEDRCIKSLNNATAAPS